MKLAVLPFLKKGPAVVEIPVNLVSKKSTKTLTTVQVHRRHLIAPALNEVEIDKLLKSWTMLNVQWSTLVSVVLVGDDHRIVT